MDSISTAFTMRQNDSVLSSRLNSVTTVATTDTKPPTVNANHDVENVETNTIYENAKIRKYTVSNVVERMRRGTLSVLLELLRRTDLRSKWDSRQFILINSG